LFLNMLFSPHLMGIVSYPEIRLPLYHIISEKNMHDSAIEKTGSLGQAIEKVKKPYFPKLIARFPWARAQASSVCATFATLKYRK
ncbi:hypothetical protein R0K19_21000, partial [Bacillus sp. SIMBA_161]